MAARMLGDSMIPRRPSSPIATNHASITGPKMLPMNSVPLRWTRNRPTRMAMVVPITIAILVGLFLVQRKGTEFIGNIFGPVMLAWFVAIGLLGLRGIMLSPSILAAISPHYAVAYLVHAGPGIAFAVLGAAFLALTGAEAMYADMGHFGRLPIQLGWFAVVRLVERRK